MTFMEKIISFTVGQRVIRNFSLIVGDVWNIDWLTDGLVIDLEEDLVYIYNWQRMRTIWALRYCTARTRMHCAFQIYSIMRICAQFIPGVKSELAELKLFLGNRDRFFADPHMLVQYPGSMTRRKFAPDHHIDGPRIIYSPTPAPVQSVSFLIVPPCYVQNYKMKLPKQICICDEIAGTTITHIERTSLKREFAHVMFFTMPTIISPVFSFSA